MSYPEIVLDEGPAPIFLRLAESVARDVQRGRLRPGDRLPSSRALAERLGVHRNTVLAAWRELERQGWIETEAARGTFVARTLPGHVTGVPTTLPTRAGFDVPAISNPAPPVIRPGTLPLLGGVPDLRHVPRAALARAYRRALRRGLGLDYGDPAGSPALREALATRLAAARGLAVTADALVVTRGSQMALDLLARVLLRPGDLVAVEAYGYRPAWRALRSTGARLLPVRVDAGGLDVARFATLLERRRIRALYLTPHHQYPTTATLSAPRRLELLRLAATHRVAILEDDYDHEFHYEGRPVLPLAARDPAGVVVHVGTLSKILAPGLRVGWVVAPAPLRDALVAARTNVDRQGDLCVEAAVADLLDDGEVQRHALRMRRLYRARRDHLARRLEERFAGRLRVRVPAGGMALWVRAPGIDVDGWAERATARGVVFQPASLFTFDGKPRRAMRLGYAALEPSELDEAVEVLAATLPGP
ncbi:MAG: PLP-dependent aminotransferase family protein [Myxococcota bacterium]